ncbi:hypothetical protein C0Q70_06732 [Pomacea canaliculata]|uniref:rRNA methyltransferase n=1 Tax=Pomacea canaliculata TaxID=400727 RepID=A0A2T7PD24_POMCA|nr:hypothetical protein C0Q70_06732 [Pomacea canaliculata]
MGKKLKVGKARKDKFYHLAKETGYRSRAAFKLIQLNRKYEFLQKSRVVIDLCAAPGGWLQVAAEHTPVSSLIVGVDLVPIRPIHRVITLQEDITTDKCRQDLKKELQTWQADCVLNDGAPNVGKSWVHDAYQQAELTLHALKLATEFLRKGGWFVTKVFRSKDYFSLMWVFQQLFKHVFATKPQASRNESAEIFVVCENYLAPDKLDPKFLDPKYVFKDVEEDVKQTINLIHPEKKQRHREGYAEGDYTLYHVLNASEFLKSEDFLEKLAASNEIVLDETRISEHPATTIEIKECCKDIRVLGKKDIRSLLSWRKVLIKDFQKAEAEQEQAKNESAEGKAEEELSENEVEEQEMQEILAKANEEELKQLKRKKRKTRKMQSKLRQKMDLKMILPNDRVDYGDDAGVFSLNKIRNQQQLDQVQEGDLSFMDKDILEEEEEEEESAQKKQRLMAAYDRASKDHLDDGDYSSGEEGEEEPEFDDDDNFPEETKDIGDDSDGNPLVVDLETRSSRTKNRIASWFNKEVFDGLEKEEDEDIEVEQMTADYEKQGGTVVAKKEEQKSSTKKVHFVSEDSQEGLSSDSDHDLNSDSDSDYEIEEVIKPELRGSKDAKIDQKAGFEVVPIDESKKLDPTGLAVGAAMTHSKKRKREIIESAYNRECVHKVFLNGISNILCAIFAHIIIISGDLNHNDVASSSGCGLIKNR